LLKNKNILIGITGGIAAYKICELIRMFKRKNANVKVVVTPNALEFVTELTLDTLSQEQVFTEQFNTEERKPEHIALCDWADVFLIAPASANTIGKLANGLCDNLLTSLACAFQKPMFIAPAMNTGMFNNSCVQKNIETLKQMGKNIIEPDSGFLACGTTGVGRLADINKVFEKVEEYFSKNQYLKGKKIVITAGGTKENIDPVRYIGNYSSGKMGKAIADKAYEAGADVVLVTTVDFCDVFLIALYFGVAADVAALYAAENVFGPLYSTIADALFTFTSVVCSTGGT
jgi:phosphopantothenoylcysteine decarboxylase/phosphopantothenate--cysteine ligase